MGIRKSFYRTNIRRTGIECSYEYGSGQFEVVRDWCREEIKTLDEELEALRKRGWDKPCKAADIKGRIGALSKLINVRFVDRGLVCDNYGFFNSEEK